MSYTITLADNRAYIIIKVKGSITRLDAMQQNLEAHELGRRLGINRYLVDATRARNLDSDIHNYEFAYKDMAMTPGIDRCAIVALMVSPEDRSHDFVVTAARNAGLHVEMFTDAERAKRYLLSTPVEGSFTDCQ
jgi:hypothetical protein